MPNWFPLTRVDAAFLDTAPVRYSETVDLPVPAERVWESITSDESVGAWGLGVRVRWTTARPFGVGARRDVDLPLRSMTIREEFFEWDEGRSFAFAVYAANRRIFRSFAERWEVEPTASGSKFTWTMAIEPAPRSRWLLRAARPLDSVTFGQMPRAARRYFKSG
jgi:hypothetical protein